MPDIRQRKQQRKTEHGVKPKHKHEKTKTVESNDVYYEEEKSRISSVIWQYFNILLGVSASFYIGYRYALYMKELHENDMWFSNIGQLEREISFRTESGLYFSYYKQLVLSPTLRQGVHDLMVDNKTEHLRTINILERFNIYQEVVLAIIYRVTSLKGRIEYVYFYINTVFGLHGMYMVSLFAATWLLSGSWIAGILANVFFIFNKADMTRLSFTIPLRESFGFPFLYVQIAITTAYFKQDISRGKQILCLWLLAIFTFLFTLVWQFAQFILLLQGMAIFGVFCLGFVPSHKIKNMFFIIIGSLLLVFVLQFMNDMIIRSLALSFSLSSLLVISKVSKIDKCDGILKNLMKVVARVFGVLTLTVVLNVCVKLFVKASSDEHIFKFLRAKFGFDEARDFDAMLYLCEMSFRMLPVDTYWRLTEGVVFPCYVFAVVFGFILLAVSVLEEWSGNDFISWGKNVHTSLKRRPEVVYHLVQTFFFTFMAVTTLRFKFLWMPHICIVAAGIICSQDLWSFLLSKIYLTCAKAKVGSSLVPIILIVLVLHQRMEGALNELKDLKEFYDPDTVDLMRFINEKTGKGRSFSGSMQLMAAVKLCTDRPITNHPHYENKLLRLRTKEIYQIYAKRTPKDVYHLLRKHGTDYVILENSICYSRQELGCKIKDILDYNNGHVIEGGVADRGLVHSDVSRFCYAIKSGGEEFSLYFKKVFENRTFYMYKLLGSGS